MGYPASITNSKNTGKVLEKEKLDYLKSNGWDDLRTFRDALILPKTDADKSLIYLKWFAPKVQQSVEKWTTTPTPKDPLVTLTAKNFYSKSSNHLVLFQELRLRFTNLQLRGQVLGFAGMAQANQKLYNELLSPKGDPQVVNLKPFRDFLEKNSPDGEIKNVRELEAAGKQNRKAVLNLLQVSRTGQQADATELDNDQIRTLRQCMLMTDLLNKGFSYYGYPHYWLPRDANGVPTGAPPFHGRIHPVTVEDWFDPDSLMNLLTISSDSKDYFLDESDAKGNVELKNELVWVYMDADKKIQESKIYFDETRIVENLINKSGQFNYSTKTNFKPESILSKGAGNEDILAVYGTNLGRGYTITNIDVTFEGTNPSTARDDVKVTLKIELDNIGSLDSICSVAVIEPRTSTSPAVKKYINLMDLVTLPTLKTVETQTISDSNKVLSGQYSPEYSRIRLKLYSTEEQTDCLIVDLATIGHEIARDEDVSGKTIFTIEYRGYFEQAMNMPFNNVFADEDTINIKLANEKVLDDLEDEKCSDALIREVVRANEEYNLIKAKEFMEKGGMLKRLLPHIYTTELQNIDHFSSNLTLDPNIAYVLAGTIAKSSDPTLGLGYSFLNTTDPDALKKAEEALAYRDESDAEFTQRVMGNWNPFLGIYQEAIIDVVEGKIRPEASNLRKLLAARNINFFYIGDLLNSCLDVIYEPNSNKHRQGLEHLNLKFIVGTMRVPVPKHFLNKNVKGVDKFITINPLQIPVELSFFLSWYHANYTKKGINFYPIGSFIRDLVGRLINDLLYEVCFSSILPNESPPQFRTAFFSDHGGKDFKSETWFNPFSPINADFNKQKRGDLDDGRQLLMVSKYNSKVQNSRNYCVLYQSSPSFFKQLRAERANKLKDEDSTITIYNGANYKNGNYCSDVTFKKTDSPFLREARYFGSSFGSLSLMSNVYDLDFKFANKKANTYFYPGNIINFILTDWAGPQHWKIGNNLGESDPHKEGTRANILGFGGYFCIKSVTYGLEPHKGPSYFTISISTKFSGTDAIDKGRGEETTNKFATEPDDCIKEANTSIQRINEVLAEDEDAILFDYVYNDPTAVAQLEAQEKAAENQTLLVFSEKIDEFDFENVSETETVELVEGPPPEPGDDLPQSTATIDPNVVIYAKGQAVAMAVGDTITIPVSVGGATGQIKSVTVIKHNGKDHLSFLDSNKSEVFKVEK